MASEGNIRSPLGELVGNSRVGTAGVRLSSPGSAVGGSMSLRGSVRRPQSCHGPRTRHQRASRGHLVASKPRAICGETPSADARAGATLARCQAMTGRLNVVSAMTALACTSRSASSTARGRPSPRTLSSCTRSRTGIARTCFIGPAPRTLASRHPAERSPRCPLPILRQVVRPVRSDDADRRAADQSERRCALGSTMTCRPARALRVIATASLADSASTCTLACRLASFKP